MFMSSRSVVSFSLTSLLLAAVVYSGSASAGVNVNNGNFYVAYTDFFLPTSGMNVEITRTYNSRSNYVKGYFGVGYSSDIEGYLSFEKGSVAYYEGGGGNIVHFNPEGKDRWTNSAFGPQVIRKVGNNYVLETSNSRFLEFNPGGQLTKISDKNKNFLEFSYNAGKIAMVRDNFNNQLKFSWGDFGGHPRVTAVESGAMKARYEYSAKGTLTRAVGVDGVPYEYAYDDEFNMTRIAYQNGSYKEMAYNKQRDWVTKFRDADGSVTSYDYFADSLDPENKFGTTVAHERVGSKEKDVSRFWYEFRRRADGTRYNYRAVTSISGLVTETMFTECCGTPLVISQWQGGDAKGSSALSWIVPPPNKRTTKFDYYADGLLKQKSGPDGTITALTYHPEFKKVASVTRAGRAVEYNYDKRGNLAWALDKAENRRLDLTYDLTGRLASIHEQRLAPGQHLNRTVFFRYNPAGKPIEVKEKNADGSEGIIRISYDTTGSVTGILNGQGKVMTSEKEISTAQRVAATFQNLLEIVQPAGISLTPEG